MLSWDEDNFEEFISKKYDDSNARLSTKIFNFKDYPNVYSHQNYDTDHVTRQRPKKTKPNTLITKYVTNYEGIMKWNLSADVNIVIVEQ